MPEDGSQASADSFLFNTGTSVKDLQTLTQDLHLDEEGQLSDQDFELLRSKVEDPKDHEMLANLVSRNVEKIRFSLPWVSLYPGFEQRLLRAGKRFIALDVRGRDLLDHAYSGMPLRTRKGGSVSSSKYLAYYNPLGDFMVLPTDHDESIDFVATEELLHSTKPFPPKTQQTLRVAWGIINEGATRHYLAEIHGAGNLPSDWTKPSSAGTNYLIGEQLWRVWIEKYGDRRMADAYFGQESFPDGIDVDMLSRGAVSYLRNVEGREDLIRQFANPEL